MTSLIWLDAVGDDDRARVGGKAFVLGRLRQAGFPVPDGFVLPAGPWGPEQREAAAAAFVRLGGPVAVRSSGTAEDGASASFAGQYLTLLDVHDEAALLDAIVRCREAEGRASAYAATLSAGTGTMAILVQRFIEPQAAGVVFTRDPRDPSRLVVEAHRGRGEAVVSGQVTPARYSIPRAGGEARREGGDSALAADQLEEVVALSNRVEAHLGAPQDVEWAWDAAGVALLQARPITVHEEAPRDPRVRRLTRANVGEVLPGPVTPLTWSALCAYLEAAFVRIGRGLDVLPDDPPPFLVLHHRRLYFNLDLCVQMVTRMPGITAEDAERLILGGGATKGQAPALRGAPGWRTVRGGFSLAHSLPARIEEAERVVRGLPPAEAIERADAAGLVHMVDDVIARCLGVADTHVSTSGASAVTMALLARLLARDGMGDPVERTGRLLAGLDGVDSVAPALALEAIAARGRANPRWREWLAQPAGQAAEAFSHHDLPAELDVALQSFLERFGHRGLSEGDLSSRAWDEDPTPVFESLQALLKSGRSPGFGPRARAEVRRADEEALFMRAGPVMRPVLTHAVRTAQQWVRRREHTKSLAVAVMRHCRRIVQAAAARLVARAAMPDRSVVDFLTMDEIRAALGGAPVPVLEAQRRRRRHESEAQLPAPREVDLSAGAVDPVAAAVEPGVLRGIGVSAGVAMGRARVVTASSPPSLSPGEILVAPVLDAGLAPLLATAGAAVAEIGGILSHGSVVAREMGVPCVVDARDATTRILDGQMVIVDGGSGVIRFLTDAASAEAAAAAVPTPVDDTAVGLHPFEDHPRARESVYFNMRDPVRGLAVVFSMAVRPGGRGEALLTLSLPDGRVLFGLVLGQAEVDAEGFRVGGFRLDWRPLRLTVDAQVAPHEAQAFPPGPIPLVLAPQTVRLRGTLALEPSTPAVDFCEALSPEAREWLRGLGSHHVEQSGRWHGDLDVDGQALRFDGRGSRDHSWGIREWEAADYWRLFMAPISDALSVHALVVSARGRLVTGGFVWREGRTEAITRVEYAAERDARGRVRSFELELSAASGPLRMKGTIEQTVTIPVDPERRLWRHLAGRPYRLLLHENFTRYEVDGVVGHGMAEFTERPL
jgi:rifampicin phosphotransferase